MPAAASLNLEPGSAPLGLDPAQQTAVRVANGPVSPDRCVLPHGRWRQPHPIGALENVLIALLVVGDDLVLPDAAAWFRTAVSGRRRTWWPPVALFLPGSLHQCRTRAFGHACRPDLRGGAWFAVTASHRVEAASMYLITTLSASLTVASLIGQGGPALAPRRQQRRSLGGLGPVVRGGRPVRRSRRLVRPRCNMGMTSSGGPATIERFG